MTDKKYGFQRRPTPKSKTMNMILLCLVIVWGIFAMGWGSYRMARHMGFHAGLGEPVFVAGGTPVYSPFAVLSWPSLPGLKGDNQIKRISDQTFMVGLGAPMILTLVAMACMSGLRGREDLHGSAKWATKDDIRTMGYLKSQGVYVGGWYDNKKKEQIYLQHNGPEHILVFAPTRSGKGVGLILPTLYDWEHSSVVLDIKGENFALTSGHLSAAGHKVLRFDPSDGEGTSAAYNPFEEIEINSKMCVPDIQRVSSMIMDPQGKGLEDYWNKAAFGFFGGALLHCMIETLEEKKRPATFFDVALMLEDPNVEKYKPKPEKGQDGKPKLGPDGKPATPEANPNKGKLLFEYILKYDHEAVLEKMYRDKGGMPAAWRKSCSDFVKSSAAGMVSKADGEFSGVLNTATSNLALYKDPIISLNTSRCDFRIRDLMNGDVPVNLYLVVSPADIDRMRPLLRIFISQLLNQLTSKKDIADGASVAKYKHRLLLMLDEFTSLGKIPIIERGIAYMAGYGIKGYFIVQDTKQLAQAYGQDNALMANCHIRIAYAPNLAETAEYLSKMLGQTTVVDKKASISHSKSGNSRSISVSETARPLLTPGECMTLPGMTTDSKGRTTPGDMLIITAGNQPIYGRQILYFVDPYFSDKAKIPAPHSSKYPGGLSDSLHHPMPNALARGVSLEQWEDVDIEKHDVDPSVPESSAAAPAGVPSAAPTAPAVTEVLPSGTRDDWATSDPFELALGEVETGGSLTSLKKSATG
jgi:type IV secretion system protein VirD4